MTPVEGLDRTESVVGFVMLHWFQNAERWQSGRSRPPRKREYLYGYREFESPPLRQSSYNSPLVYECGSRRASTAALKPSS
jgi:hypothetical protein